MNNTLLFACAGIFYAAAAGVYCLRAADRWGSNPIRGGHMLTAGMIVHTAAYAIRWIETARMGLDQTPLSLFTLYESLVFGAWALTAFFLLFSWSYRAALSGCGFGTALCAALLLGYASFSGSVNPAIQELPTVLRGNLFVPHAISSTAAFSAFLLACIASVQMLVHGRLPLLRTAKETTDFSLLDDCNYRLITIGFFLYTLCIATGAYRCKVIWGRYWSWDPSEISSLIVWVLYAMILHGRYQRWWRPRTTAALTLIAFFVACLCFVISAQIIMASRHYPIQ